MNLDFTTHGKDQIRVVSASPSLPRDLWSIIRSKQKLKTHKPGKRSFCCAVGHRRAAWMWSGSYSIRNKNIWKFILWTFWPDIWKFAPTKISCYTVLPRMWLEQYEHHPGSTLSIHNIHKICSFNIIHVRDTRYEMIWPIDHLLYGLATESLVQLISMHTTV